MIDFTPLNSHSKRLESAIALGGACKSSSHFLLQRCVAVIPTVTDTPQCIYSMFSCLEK